MRRAYSLIELVFAVVILGVISSIGINLMLVLYQNHATSERVMSLQLQSQNTLEQIAKLLAARIPQSAIAKDWQSENFTALTKDTSSNYDTLEFVTYTPEAFYQGFYSGFADLEKTTKHKLVTPASSLRSLNETIKDLNPNFKENFELAVIFKSLNYNASDFGYNKKEPNLAFAKVANEQNFELDNSRRKDTLISEHYHIAHTAYSLRLEPSHDKTHNNLVLYFNYRPWLGESAKDKKSDYAILANNVSTFAFRSKDDVIELKLCLTNENLDTMCKSKVIQ